MTNKLSIVSKLRQDFNLNGINKVYFWKSEWEDIDVGDKWATVSIPYLLYRFMYMAFFISSVTTDMICSSSLNLYFIFLTHLSFFTQMLYSVIFFILVVWVRFMNLNRDVEECTLLEENKEFPYQQPKLPLLNKIVWILINIVNVVPYGVTLVYWTFLHSPGTPSTKCGIVTNILTHAINSAVAFIDLMIIAVPIRRTHLLFPFLATLSYIIFSIMYEIGGGPYRPGDNSIYSILNWNMSPRIATLTSLFGLCFGIVGHFIFCWEFYRFRVFIARVFNK